MPCGPAGLLLVFGLARLFGAADSHGDTSATPVSAQDEIDEGTPVVSSYEDALSRSPALEHLDRKRWIRHRIRPRERLTQIAARYGVRLEKLLEWNELPSDSQEPPRGLRSLRVRAQRVPPPRYKARYRIQDGEGWGDIAARFRVEQPDLRAWNWRMRTPRPGEYAIVWVDPAFATPLHRNTDALPPEPVTLPAGGRSVGRPHRGRLEEGLELPESSLYTKGHKGGLFGSRHTLEVLLAAFASFRHQSAYDGEVIIGAISRRRGRKFPPHISHQSGRDIDIRLPLLPGVPPVDRPNPDEVDWYATWSLVKSFVDSGEVSVIFLDVHLQRRLYEAARVMGESHESLREVITWPSWKGKKRPLVRHFAGHDAHIHVRVRCGDDEPRCRER